VLGLELAAPALLPGAHAALAAQAGVGEGVGEVTLGADVQVIR
jgi:hypothetical protein